MSEYVFQLAFQFIQQEPRAAARLLETSDSEEIVGFLKNTPAPMVARLLREMQAEHAARLLVNADSQTAQLWMRELRSRTLSAFLRRLDGPQQENLLSGLTLKKKAACQLLLSFREDMVGAIVETDIIAFPVDMAVSDAIKRLKQRHYKEQSIAFVINSDRTLSGEVSIPQLLKSHADAPLADIQQACDDTISGRALIRSTLRHPIWRQRDCAAVINRQRELIGVLWYSQLRQALSMSVNKSSSQSNLQHAVLELVQAHGNSMRALLDLLY